MSLNLKAMMGRRPVGQAQRAGVWCEPVRCEQVDTDPEAASLNREQ